MNFLIAVLLLFFPSVAFGQYVAATLQQRIDDDQKAISLDQADIVIKNEDIQNIINDPAAGEVTSQVPDVLLLGNQQASNAKTSI